MDKEFDDSVNIADFLLENNIVDKNTRSYLKLPYIILNRLWNRVKTKPAIEYHLKNSKTLDEVLNIFVRINNGGEKSFNVSNDFILKAFLVLCDDGNKDRKSIKFTVENFKSAKMQKIRDD